MREGGSAQVAVCGELRCREGGDDDGEMRMEILLGQSREDAGGKLRKAKRYPTHSPQGADETI